MPKIKKENIIKKDYCPEIKSLDLEKARLSANLLFEKTLLLKKSSELPDEKINRLFKKQKRIQPLILGNPDLHTKLKKVTNTDKQNKFISKSVNVTKILVILSKKDHSILDEISTKEQKRKLIKLLDIEKHLPSLSLFRYLF